MFFSLLSLGNGLLPGIPNWFDSSLLSMFEFLTTLESLDFSLHLLKPRVKLRRNVCIYNTRIPLPVFIFNRMCFPCSSGIAFFHENHALCPPNHLLSFQAFLFLSDNSRYCWNNPWQLFLLGSTQSALKQSCYPLLDTCNRF
jgi:hypothetical protein